MKNALSIICHWNSSLQSLRHESLPINTKPGIQPTNSLFQLHLQADVRLHVYNNVPFNVDLEHSDDSDDGSDR